MPYAKKHHRKFGKRKRAVSKAVKRYVKKEIRQAPEVKYTELTTIGPGANVTGSGAVYSFSGYPTQGTSVGGRIGDKIIILKNILNFLKMIQYRVMEKIVGKKVLIAGFLLNLIRINISLHLVIVEMMEL
jgi:hypothetical protein